MRNELTDLHKTINKLQTEGLTHSTDELLKPLINPLQDPSENPVPYPLSKWLMLSHYADDFITFV